jgi:hypothetical protein
LCTFKLIGYCAVHQDSVVCRVLLSRLAARSRHKKYTWKIGKRKWPSVLLSVISAFCPLSSYDTARYTRIVLFVGSFRQVGGAVQTKEVQTEKNCRYFCFTSFKLIRYCAVHHDRIVRRVLPSSWRRGPDKRRTNGKITVISAFRNLSLYDTERYTRIVLFVRSFSQAGKTAGKMAVNSALCYLSSYDTAWYTRIVLSVGSFSQVGSFPDKSSTHGKTARENGRHFCCPQF